MAETTTPGQFPTTGYDAVAAALAAAPSGPGDTGPLRALGADRVAVVLGDAGVGSTATLLGAAMGAVQVADGHFHRWRERLGRAGMPLEAAAFAEALAPHLGLPSATAALYAAAATLAAPDARVVMEAHADSPFWDDPAAADLVVVATAADAQRAAEQVRRVATAASTVVLGPQRESVADAVRRATVECGARLQEVSALCKLGNVEARTDSQRFTVETPARRFTLELPALGAHQRSNAATALLAAGEVEPRAVAQAAQRAALPLRFESLRSTPRVVADAADSRPAYRALERAWRDARLPTPLLLAMVDSGTNLSDLTEALVVFGGDIRVAFAAADRPTADALATTLRERGLPVQLVGAPGPALDQLATSAGPREAVLAFGARRPTADARAYLLGLMQDPR